MGAGGTNGDTSGSLRSLLGITEEFYQKTYRGYHGKHAFSILPVLMQPKSLGRVSLKDTNPFHWPKMEANYFKNKQDLDDLRQGVKMAVELGESASFKKIGAIFNPNHFYGCENHKFRSDEYWDCCIRQVASSLQHQVGTCKMGPASDPDAVVNPQLQVVGIKNLRVVDASIMPVIPAAHTNAVVFMIGEKGADLVKEYWRNRV